MGTVFEELVRKFNEDNNEEAGEHWTPRDAVRLMANLVFLPIENEIKSGTYLLYDCACGTGGMLTVAEETLTAIAAKRKQKVNALLYGQEINPETYAVCKADMLLKGEGENADHIVGGAEWSTLSNDAFPAQRVRLHARQSALRQELEERPRSPWAARTACATRASRSCIRAKNCRWSPAPATARCCSSPTWRRR